MHELLCTKACSTARPACLEGQEGGCLALLLSWCNQAAAPAAWQLMPRPEPLSVRACKGCAMRECKMGTALRMRWPCLALQSQRRELPLHR